MATLTVKTRKDFQWWYRFRLSWNGVAMMLDVHLSAAADMELYTDVSGSYGLAHTTVELGSTVTGSRTRCLNRGSLQHGKNCLSAS